MKLFELFDNSFQYSITFNTSMKRVYAISGTKSEDFKVIFFFDFEDDSWVIEFTSNNRHILTGDNEQFRVFATIAKILNEFIADKKPTHIKFSIGEEELSREKAYASLLYKYAKKHSYSFTKDSDGIDIWYKIKLD